MSPRVRPHPVRPLAGFVALAAVVVALALGFAAAPAGAHEGDAIVTLEAAHPAGLSIHYFVRVTWENDGHPANDATVTATAIGPDGTQLTPVTLTPADDDGRYEGVVDYPAAGTWTLRLTSIDPTGTLEQTQEVAAAPATEPAEDASEVTTAPDGGFAPADDGTGDTGEAGDAGGSGDDAAAAADSDGGSDSGMPVYLIVAAAAVAVIGVATAVNIVRRKRVAPSGGGATPPGE
jgi:YtkA-like